MIITIGGRAGTGKSTIANLLAQKLNLKHYSNGDFMREMAEARGISLPQLSKIAETNSAIDKELDDRQIALGKIEDNFIIDSRLGFHFIPNSIKIFLDADADTRAKRILLDKARKEQNADIKETKENVLARESSENKRYNKYYGVKPYDAKNFNLIIDTTSLQPEQVANQILGFINKAN